MRVKFLFISLFLSLIFITSNIFSENPRFVMDLNGLWEFEQTKTAFPPERFTRSIQVPGLIDLAEPRIDQYDEYFLGTHEPRYSWYRCKFSVSPENRDKFAVLNLLKSQYDTQVILNGHDLGTYMQCNTPIECNLTEFISYKDENILLIRVGEQAWLPKQSATGTDVEKRTFIPGVWDDVFITFTGPIRVERSLILPDMENSKVTAKILIENHAKIHSGFYNLISIKGTVSIYIKEKKSGLRVTEDLTENIRIRCQQRMPVIIELPLKNPHPWSPDDPFLYEAVVSISADGKQSDLNATTFGMRDFKTYRRTFRLNGQQIKLHGSTINLYRFFEDRERAGLPWNREWAKKLLIDIPKSLRWNAFRMCIGLAPKFWYDLADEYGILIQNEYPMWQVRGWNEQIHKEYTDWIWADGSHPSIIIWDAMNEQRHAYIGNVLIPELRLLDPTRIWDAGYMTENDMVLNDMDEPHDYPLSVTQGRNREMTERRRLAYRFGKLFSKRGRIGNTRDASVPQVLNEYGWIWINRDGTPSLLAAGFREPGGTNKGPKTLEGNFEYYVGSGATPQENWEFQAYVTELQTEAFRSSRSLAGLLSFCYLSNNYGFTCDWFVSPIKDLIPSPTLSWQYHSFAPFAIFIDLEDARYLKNPQIFEPSRYYSISLFGVNDTPEIKNGEVVLKIIDIKGDVVVKQSASITVDSFWETLLVMTIKFPDTPGGYLMLSELHANEGNIPVQLSRRYIRIGDIGDVSFPEYPIDFPPNWQK